MVQRTCDEATSQRIVTWLASPEPGFRNLMFQHSGKCLRVQSNSTGGRAQVVQDTCTQTNDRSFKFVE
jgi:hypothetical protein